MDDKYRKAREEWEEYERMTTAQYGKAIEEPAFLRREFVRGFGPVDIIACANCGSDSEQYTKGRNPTEYFCENCSAITYHLGAGWYMKTIGAR